MNIAIVEQYLSAGKRLFTLSGRVPNIKAWNTSNQTRAKILGYKDNLGWAIGETNLVVDVDPRNGGDESFKQLCLDLDLNLKPTVDTPRGGQHYYLKIPLEFKGYKVKKTSKTYPGIDFLSDGAYCIICSSETEHGKYTWSDDLTGEFEQFPAPKSLMDLISYNPAKDPLKADDSIVAALGDFEGLLGGEGSNFSEEQVLDMLDRIDNEISHDEWVKVGMALHNWDPVNGLEIWEDWSKGAGNYVEFETEKRWGSFNVDHGVTMGTISYMANSAAFEKSLEATGKMVKAIRACQNEKELEFDIIGKIKKKKLSKLNREKLAAAIQSKYIELTGVRLPISAVRASITKTNYSPSELVTPKDVPFWCKEWLYVNSHAGFIHLDTLELHKSESFNVENGMKVPPSEGGTKPSASKYVADHGYINKVGSIAYLPTVSDKICTIGGITYLNSFDSSTVPSASQDFTQDGLLAIDIVKRHIKFICTNDEDSDILTQWLAHQIQYPGKQILWSPIIQSIQGVGKSFFGELLRRCIGDRNVGVVSPTQVASQFNGWATNVVVNVLEELRVAGHNRHDAVNALKPLITDRMIQINDKGVKQYMTYNTTNYMCFTNFKDALPLDGDDRRWWVIFVPIQSLDKMFDFVGEDAVTYFRSLFGAINSNSGELRKWLMEYPITDKFMATKRAPQTAHKLSMIATQDASFEGFGETRDMLGNPHRYYNKDVVSSSDLFDDMMMKYPNIEIHNSRSKHLVLKKLGFSKHHKIVKIDGKARSIWTKFAMTNDEIRSNLMENFLDL